MTDRPILFSAPMVRALLEGRKTQTRRGIEPVTDEVRPGDLLLSWPAEAFIRKGARFRPKFAVGDRLYVRGEYYQRGHWEPVPGARTKGGKQKWAFIPADDVIMFEPPTNFRKGRHQQDPATIDWHKRLGRFMPRAASRLTLFVTEVRVERLQDIGEADARAEGLGDGDFEGMDPRCWYRDLWDNINGAGAWDANPWVVAVSFEVIRANIDHHLVVSGGGDDGNRHRNGPVSGGIPSQDCAHAVPIEPLQAPPSPPSQARELPVRGGA